MSILLHTKNKPCCGFESSNSLKELMCTTNHTVKSCNVLQVFLSTRPFGPRRKSFNVPRRETVGSGNKNCYLFAKKGLPSIGEILRSTFSMILEKSTIFKKSFTNFFCTWYPSTFGTKYLKTHVNIVIFNPNLQLVQIFKPTRNLSVIFLYKYK